SMGEAGRSFIPDIQQASSSSLMSAILAGIIFNISNILLVASMTRKGCPSWLMLTSVFWESVWLS
ncbi:hypothetical protein ACSLO8_28615, partial [Escherichia coli]